MDNNGLAGLGSKVNEQMLRLQRKKSGKGFTKNLEGLIFYVRFG